MPELIKNSVKAIKDKTITGKRVPKALLNLIDSNGRSLKIQPQPRETMSERFNVPEIKLCGIWLEKAGFYNGRTIKVTALKNVLILSLNEQVPEKKVSPVKAALRKTNLMKTN